MLTLDAELTLPAHVTFSVVGADAFLLNTRTNKYYLLQEVGARLWELLRQGHPLRACHATLLAEYEVSADQLERDMLNLLNDLLKHGLVLLAA